MSIGIYTICDQKYLDTRHVMLGTDASRSMIYSCLPSLSSVQGRDGYNSQSKRVRPEETNKHAKHSINDPNFFTHTLVCWNRNRPL